jgi:hypothetical protein
MEHVKRIDLSVVKKTGISHTLWFPPSQSFVLLKGPAYKAFQLIQKGEPNEKIIPILARQTNSPENEILSFLTDLRTQFEKLMDPANLPYKPLPVEEEMNHYSYVVFAQKFYRIKGIIFGFTYGSSEFLLQIHPLLAHLSIEDPGKIDYSIEVFARNEFLFFRLNGKLVEHFRTEHMHYLKGAVSKKMTGLIYSVPEDGWMATLHASAVSDGKSAILFSAQPGSGKSTVAALLQAQGYLLLSDDIIALDKEKEEIWQMPMALSVKEGSVKLLSEYYPQLNDTPLQRAPTGKKVRYLPPLKNIEAGKNSFPVKTIIFIRYSPDVPFLLEKVKPEEALMSLLAETWVNPEKENVARFLEWFGTMKCIRITYSDHEKLFAEIKKQFKSPK